jgi:integrase
MLAAARRGRPSEAGAFREFVEACLQQDPKMTSTEVMRRTTEAGYTGGKSALFALVATVRARPSLVPRVSDQLAVDAVTRDTLTLSRAWDVYCNANGGRVRSLDTDRGRARHLFAFFGPDKRCATLTLEDVDAYRAQRRREVTVRKGPPSPATRNREVELLARLLAFAVSRRLLAANPLSGVEYEPQDNVREVVVKEDLLERILAVCAPWLRAFVLVAIDSGMRRTEIATLRWDRVDLEQGLINLSAVSTKTRLARTTILSDRARRAIADLPRSERWVFPSSRTAGHIDPSHVTSAFRWTLKDAGIAAPDGGPIWLHDLRRSFVTNSRRRGIAETVVMKMTGHRTASVFERYNIKGVEDVLRAREVLGGAHPAPNRVEHPIAEVA